VENGQVPEKSGGLVPIMYRGGTAGGCVASPPSAPPVRRRSMFGLKK